MANRNMLETRSILDSILGAHSGPFGIGGGPPGGAEALTTMTTEALKRRARTNLSRERMATQRKLEGTKGWEKLTPEQRVYAFETRDTDLAKRISQRLKALESGQRRVTGSLDPGVKLGIFRNDIEAGLNQLQQPNLRNRLQELLSGKRGGLSPNIAMDRLWY